MNVFALTAGAVGLFVAEAHDGDEAMDPAAKVSKQESFLLKRLARTKKAFRVSA